MEELEIPQPNKTPEIPQNQVVAGSPRKTSPLMEILAGVKERFSSIFSRLTFISPGAKKALSIAVAVLAVLALIAIFVPLIKKLLQKPVEETQEVDTAQLTLTTKKLSRYATESAVLKVETDVQNLDSELNALEVKESKLNPPPLNWDVNFEE
ncbi:hypothetical protein A2115_02535 [Candidatus Woesebacteria bacterium GWA1_41_8]|uniref:Uncharacterized protein n=1 Tax=Candidatus Woesebacteria bacterium GWA1_41_8 TaxID=1802471 RepID=A0A1F7WHM3_9BACT|nr:MAG: hypothetical protein A2115_02535 [Candidatus Woesebacteria bacterium GWA1_41_8]